MPMRFFLLNYSIVVAGEEGGKAKLEFDVDTRFMRHSRGALTTKIHALVDTNGLPVGLKITPGQALDRRSAEDILDRHKGRTNPFGRRA